jgi:hypothetical protein
MGGMKKSAVLKLAMLIGSISAFSAPAYPATCNSSDFGAIVDQTAHALRDLNISGAKSFQEKLAALRKKSGLSQEEIEARAAAIQDEKIEEFNRKIDSLVNKMDALAQTPNQQITCQKLDELKQVRDQLLTVMGQKSGYMLARADALLDKPAKAVAHKPTETTPVSKPSETATVDAPQTKPEAPRKPLQPKPPVKEAKADPAKPAQTPTSTEQNNWRPQTANNQSYGDNGSPSNLTPPPVGQLPPQSEDNTFNMAEIREAGRGLFGSISAEFAGAIDFAFGKFGQPNAYITGGEGGAAFLAGLRYGEGVLHRKGYPSTRIYWQGPSAGFDMGAEGSRSLFLIYNMNEPDGIYGRFSGIGGSAYVAGGVGINVLGKDGVVMVPIRSGVGLRLGANLAYLKFTDHQSWNPF